MSTPKLKVYRLNSGYSIQNDDDIQYLENDELLPVSIKNLNPWNTEVMVGVESKSDARIVQENSTNRYVDLNMSEDGGIVSTYKTESVYCDDWILGQENIYVYVKKQEKGAASSGSAEEIENITRDNLYEYDGWYRIPSKWFRYVVTKTKVFYDENGITTVKENAIGFTYVSQLFIELGNQLFSGIESDTWWNNIGYENFEKIEQVRIGYRTFSEMGEEGLQNFSNGIITTPPPDIRVPFDNIYNGNKNGRIKVEGDYDTTDTYTSDKSILEGNYLYKRSIYPLRFKIATENLSENELASLPETAYSKDGLIDENIDGYDPEISSKYQSEYVRDAILSKIGASCSCVFKGTINWIIDGDAKPVLMEKRKAFNPDGSFSTNSIFIPIDEGTQINNLRPVVKSDGITYKVNFISEFYIKNTGVYIFPKEVFLFFNENNDRKEFVFYDDRSGKMTNGVDFNYNYSQMERNTGLIVVNENCKNPNIKSFYRKNDLIAVKRNYGYDDTNRFILLNEVENESGWLDGVIEINEQLELAGSTNKISLFNEIGAGAGIYFKTKKIWDGMNTTDDYDISWNYDNDYQKYIVRIHPVSSEIALPDDVMIVYYEIHDMEFSKIQTLETIITEGENQETESPGDESSEWQESSSNESSYSEFEENSSDSSYFEDESSESEFPQEQSSMSSESPTVPIIQTRVISERNPWCFGYRVVCYQKVKSSNLFISSFPNWVKDHLNNNVDVFVGNTLYSGTDTSNFASDGIYPNYKKNGDGYAVNYSEGSIHFIEKVEQIDYNDIRNFASQINSNITIENNTTDNNLKIYYQKVRANYAYYNGLYNVLRGRMSCYSIQEGGFWYALIEDDYYKDSVGRRMVVRKDDYVRMIYESGTETLPKVKTSDPNRRETLSTFTEFNANPSNYIRVNTISDRATCINYIPSAISSKHGIIILNKSYTGVTSVETNAYNLDDNDIRIHIKIDRNNVFNIGLVSSLNLEQRNEFAQEVDWVPLPDTEDVYDYEGMSIDDIYENKIQRWVYSNDTWYYDVVFEIFSYRYNNTSGKRDSLSSVEFLIYKIDKE